MRLTRSRGICRNNRIKPLSLNHELMLGVQHLALDKDRFVNDLVEEGLRALLMKHREKRKDQP